MEKIIPAYGLMWKLNTHVISARNTVSLLSQSFLIVTLVQKVSAKNQEMNWTRIPGSKS